MKSRAMQTALCGLLILSGLLASSGCENNDGNEWERLVCEVQSVNAGAPLISAFLSAGSDKLVGTADDFQPIDSVVVTFHARPYSSSIVLPEDGVYSWFHVTSYDVAWTTVPAVLAWETTPGDTTTVDLSDYNITDGQTDAIVPVNEEAEASVLLVDTFMKNDATNPWFLDLYNGSIPSFQANAEITFHGHESGSDEEIDIPAGVRVSFIGVLVEGD